MLHRLPQDRRPCCATGMGCCYAGSANRIEKFRAVSYVIWSLLAVTVRR